MRYCTNVIHDLTLQGKIMHSKLIGVFYVYVLTNSKILFLKVNVLIDNVLLFAWFINNYFYGKNLPFRQKQNTSIPIEMRAIRINKDTAIPI